MNKKLSETKAVTTLLSNKVSITVFQFNPISSIHYVALALLFSPGANGSHQQISTDQTLMN